MEAELKFLQMETKNVWIVKKQLEGIFLGIEEFFFLV